MRDNEEYRAILAEYSKSYDIESLATPNDRANLDTIIMNTLSMRSLQTKLLELTQEDIVAKAQDIKRINDSIIALSTMNLQVERQLSIDRKTRKSESEQSVVEYINWLKSTAKEYLEDSERLLKVYCKRCQIMVGRISGVYDTTEFNAEFQCPQCKKMIRVSRKEKDVFFDVKDADWRRKYPFEVVQPTKNAEEPDFGGEEDEDLIISAGEDLIYEEDDNGNTQET